ncbi:MAG: hypothetical protein ACKVRO_08650 [Micropepsaceae bacterium]
MLKLTNLSGFAAGGGPDATPDALAFGSIFDAGVTASAATNVATVTGLGVAIALRLTLSSDMTDLQVVHVYVNGLQVAEGTSGATIDVNVANNQTLQFIFTNADDNTIWAGTATLTNLSDAGVTLDTFDYWLQDTGLGGGGGGGEGNPPP